MSSSAPIDDNEQLTPLSRPTGLLEPEMTLDVNGLYLL